MREIKFRAWDSKQMIFNAVIANGKYLDLKEMEYKNYPLLQYTGLKDKNGKEIYEGDILQWGEGGRNYSGYWVVYDYTGFKLCNGRYHKTILVPSWYEVIGNIYENPELLEVQAK